MPVKQIKNKRNFKQNKSDISQLYNIENILDIKVENRKKLYLIKWEGYGDEYNTWEPFENLVSAKNYIILLEKKLKSNIDIINSNEENLNSQLNNKNNQTKSKSRESTNFLNHPTRKGKNKMEETKKSDKPKNINFDKMNIIELSSEDDDIPEEDIKLIGKKRRKENTKTCMESIYNKNSSEVDKNNNLEHILERIVDANFKNSRYGAKYRSTNDIFKGNLRKNVRNDNNENHLTLSHKMENKAFENTYKEENLKINKKSNLFSFFLLSSYKKF